MTFASKLDQKIKAVCPISGISIGRKDDKSTWRISFVPAGSPQERAAAAAVLRHAANARSAIDEAQGVIDHASATLSDPQASTAEKQRAATLKEGAEAALAAVRLVPEAEEDAAIATLDAVTATDKQQRASQAIIDAIDIEKVALDGIAENKLQQINDAFEAAAAQLTAGYPPSEKMTWPMQQDEALAWRANNVSPTPFIDTLATARGISRAKFLSKTVAKVTAFRAASAQLVGAMQKCKDRVKAATTAAQIDAIDPVF